MLFHNHRLQKKKKRRPGWKVNTLSSHSLKAMLKSFIRNSPKSLPFVCAVTILLTETFPHRWNFASGLGSFSGTSQISREQGVNLVPGNFSSPEKVPVFAAGSGGAGGSCCSADRFQLDGCSSKWQNVTEPRLCCRTGFISLLYTCVQLGY